VRIFRVFLSQLGQVLLRVSFFCILVCSSSWFESLVVTPVQFIVLEVSEWDFKLLDSQSVKTCFSRIRLLIICSGIAMCGR